MRVLVTGATGFVGRHLVEYLQQRDIAVVAATREPSKNTAIPDLAGHVHFDLAAPENLKPQALEGIDCVFHLAARVHVMRQASADAEQFARLNASASEVLAKTAAAAGVRRFVFLSSIKVNGERTDEHPFTIDDDPSPQDAYGISKWRAEQALQRVAESTGLNVVILRPPLIYGPGVGANFLRLMSLAHSGIPLPFARIENRRSLVSTWNLVDCMFRAASATQVAGGTFLVSDEEDVSTARLLALMRAAMKKPLRLVPVPARLLRRAALFSGLGREFDRLLYSLQVDVSRTTRLLGWNAPVSLADGLVRTVEWYVRKRNAGC